LIASASKKTAWPILENTYQVGALKDFSDIEDISESPGFWSNIILKETLSQQRKGQWPLRIVESL
jgi:hypothetical protein